MQPAGCRCIPGTSSKGSCKGRLGDGQASPIFWIDIRFRTQRHPDLRLAFGCDAFSCERPSIRCKAGLPQGRASLSARVAGAPAEMPAIFHGTIPFTPAPAIEGQEGCKRPITPHIVIRSSFMLSPTGERPVVSAMSPEQGNGCWERGTQNAVACDFVKQRRSRRGIITRVRQARRSSTDPYLGSRPVT